VPAGLTDHVVSRKRDGLVHAEPETAGDAGIMHRQRIETWLNPGDRFRVDGTARGGPANARASPMKSEFDHFIQ
jgi:hypothetical protein